MLYSTCNYSVPDISVLKCIYIFVNCRGSQRNRRRSRVSERLDEERQANSRFQKRNKRHVEKINEIRQKNIARNKPASLKRYKLSKQLAIKRVAKALFYSNSKSAQLKLDKALAESSLYKHKKPTNEESTIPTNHPEDPFPERKTNKCSQSPKVSLEKFKFSSAVKPDI